MSKGYVKIHRDVQYHWIYQNDRYFKWWITILLNVNHAAVKFPVNGELVECRSGESFRSINDWCHLFGCNKKAFYKFVSMLESDQMVMRKTIGKGNRRKHLLTVVNWQKFQQEGEPKGYRNGTPKSTPNKNDKNEEELFARFWDLYDKKTGKKKTVALWNKLSEADKLKIIDVVPVYVRMTPDSKYRKDPATFLNNESWKDEIYSKQKKQAKGLGQ